MTRRIKRKPVEVIELPPEPLPEPPKPIIIPPEPSFRQKVSRGRQGDRRQVTLW